MNNQLLLSLAARSFAPPLLALIIVYAWRKSSASNRRMVWLMAFVVLAILPLALMKQPKATVYDNTWTAGPAASAVLVRDPVIKVIKSTKNAITAVPAKVASPITSSPGFRSDAYSLGNITREVVRYGLFVWVFGALLILSHWLAGLVHLSRLQRQPVLDEDLIFELETACQRVGLRKMPLLSTSRQASAPMVYGHFRPHLVLPVDVRGWSTDAVGAVFLHECAHLRRCDWLGLMFSRVVTALYWFNPIAWVAAKQFRAECEAAADDTVILCGVKPGSYASELLRIATDIQPTAIANSLALFEAGPLKKRIERILERDRSRGSVSPKAFGFSLIVSLILTATFGFSYQVIDAPISAHNGRADLGQGRYARIVAIVKRTPDGTQAWNVRGELLPNSFPVPDENYDGIEPGVNVRYIVFALNHGSIAIQEPESHKLRGTRSLSNISSNKGGRGYYVTLIDGDPLMIAGFVADGSASASISCKYVDRQPNSPLESIKAWKHAKDIVFDRVPLNPTGPVATTADLAIPSIQTVSSTRQVGALIGVVDLTHPEWGYWRPDGTPLPPIPGVDVPGIGDSNHPTSQVTRRIGFLYRSREGSTDGVISGDASGVLLASYNEYFHTSSGRYDLDAVFLDPSLSSLRLFSKVPKADEVVGRLKLNRISPSQESEKISQFFANRIGRNAPCFAFGQKLGPAGNGMNRSLRFLCADNSTPAFVGVSTDWDDNAVAVETKHPEKIVAANLLQHGYDYFSYGNVALYPKGRH